MDEDELGGRVRVVVVLALLTAACGSVTSEPPRQEITAGDDTVERPPTEIRVAAGPRVELAELTRHEIAELEYDAVEVLEGGAEECAALMRHPLSQPPATEGVVARLIGSSGTICEGQLEAPELRGEYSICEGCGDGLVVDGARWTVSSSVRGCESFRAIVAVLSPPPLRSRLGAWEEAEETHPLVAQALERVAVSRVALRDRYLAAMGYDEDVEEGADPDSLFDGQESTQSFVAEIDGVAYAASQVIVRDPEDCAYASHLSIVRETAEGHELVYTSTDESYARLLLVGDLDGDHGLELVVHSGGEIHVLALDDENSARTIRSGASVPELNCPGLC